MNVGQIFEAYFMEIFIKRYNNGVTIKQIAGMQQ